MAKSISKITGGNSSNKDTSTGGSLVSAPRDMTVLARLSVSHNHGLGIDFGPNFLSMRQSCPQSASNPTNAAAQHSPMDSLWQPEVKFVPNPGFENAVGSEVLCEMPAERQLRTKAPKGLPPYLADLYNNPLLTGEQEAHLFRKMNFLLYLARELQNTVQTSELMPSMAQLNRFEFLLAAALAVKNELILANLRLVVAIAKRYINNEQIELFELVSEGNMSLIRAVEKFDFARGNRFSTYATSAIKHSFARFIPKEGSWRRLFTSVETIDTVLPFLTEPDKTEREVLSNEAKALVCEKGLKSLNSRERDVIVHRFGLEGAEEMTLEDLGHKHHVSKERIRQIESEALEMLRTAIKTY